VQNLPLVAALSEVAAIGIFGSDEDATGTLVAVVDHLPDPTRQYSATCCADPLYWREPRSFDYRADLAYVLMPLRGALVHRPGSTFNQDEADRAAILSMGETTSTQFSSTGEPLAC